ncbi:glycosyltransferase [Frigoriglobus tundricola]|uniref:Glycosyltransferase 2-like domain-containing protein n=1 Tax=Frigoriglobus tundricola TaxID=2774151 RepID=A0A6M5Z0H1_9BACT|nr:glycosyltransferase [Frigoriglobus tundricola]QJW98702.1 hypothetical protein FTUN_6297 [Frigoriglobus tundricola]
MSDLLTIGMATHGEYDSVWFTLRGLLANHPRVRYLVVDNTPEIDVRTRAITRAVGGTYLHRPDLVGTSKPRDAVFRFAETPWVMCIDSHVLLETGAVQAALDYCAARPDSRDLIQGPMVYDDGRGYATHWEPKAAPMFDGTWATDERGQGTVPFEIPSMGLGLWLMRRAAWPGFNPLFRGFGGEEGYLHEIVRQRGGKALCLPALRWCHKFRDIGGWNKNPAPPYPLRLEDHTWNLLVGHREAGLEVEPAVHEHFGKRLPPATWQQLVHEARAAQPLGGPRPEVKRQKVLAVWYSDNGAPPTLLQRSGETVAHAARQTLRHDVTVSAVSWAPVPGAPFGPNWHAYGGARRRGYDNIVAQIEQAVREATAGGRTYDAVAFCEHDTLYPPDYFDRIGDALAAHPDAPVVSNLECIGLNATGWLRLREQHEPLHQLTLRWAEYEKHIAWARAAAATGKPVELEPKGDTATWARVGSPVGMSSVHVNHTAGRNTTHGEVCYEPQGYALFHPHWGPAQEWWPGPMTTIAETPAAFKDCGCNKPVDPPVSPWPDLQAWADAVAREPNDFHEHVPTVRELAARCTSATEFAYWPKPANVGLAAGLPADGTLVSYSPHGNAQWGGLKALMGERFTAGPPAERIAPTDLLFLDTAHTAEALYPLLDAHHGQVRKYIVVHCTETYGEVGDRPGAPGVMHALRTFCLKHPEWVVKRHDRNNNGLMVLSRCAEDVKELPSLWRKAMNYAGAMKRHVANGRKTVPLEVLEERQGHCATCEERALDACAACGCPLESKLPLASEQCGLAKKGLPPKWEAVA